MCEHNNLTKFQSNSQSIVDLVTEEPSGLERNEARV
jgi:hypothetical protein